MNLPTIAEPQDVQDRMSKKDSFIVNVTATWCGDCMFLQKPLLPDFVDQMKADGLDVVSLVVQHERGVYLSPEHEALTQTFGGPGYPRTILILNGQIVDGDNVEVMTQTGINTMAARFRELKSLAQAGSAL
jgi:thiol-disulfide isomerase/thioredoxin